MFSSLSALTGVGIPLIQKFSSASHFWEMRIIHLMPYQKLSGGWCPSSLQGKKIHSLLSSALFWPGSISRAGHDLKLKTLVIIGIWGGSISSLIIWLSLFHQAQQPIEWRLHVYAGRANSDPSLDWSLQGLWPLKQNNRSISPVQSLTPLCWSQPKAKGSYA